MPYSIQEVRGAVARGWCADANRHKEMDGDLAEAISQEILQMLSSPAVSLLRPATAVTMPDASTPEGRQKIVENSRNYRDNLKPFA